MSLVATAPRPVLASQFFARTQSSHCDGTEECHWCAGPCQRLHIHDNPPPVPFVKDYERAKRPSNPFICVGCWLWRRKRVTVRFLGGVGRDALKDGQCALNHSWLITETSALVISKDSQEELKEFVLAPHSRFILAFLDDPTGLTKNHLHLMVANDLPEVLADTPLVFTVNNVPFVYSVYELETAITQGTGGRLPGVAQLFRLLGIPEPVVDEDGKLPKREAGRPAPKQDGRVTQQIVIPKPQGKNPRRR